MFFWGVMHGLNRLRQLRAITKLSGPDLLPSILDGLRTYGVDGVAEELKTKIVQYSPLLRRIRIVLEQWCLRPSLQNTNLAIEQQVISDQDATQRGYSLLRIFVWATPVLGLIGTVVGISIAVGGFASFLSTNVDDVSKIKEGLVGVTGGLSFAFMITLEGLLSSLILMVFTSMIQTREERFYAGIDQSLAERFLPELQRISPEEENQSPDSWGRAMSEAVQKVMNAVETAGKKLLESWDDRHEGYIADIRTVQEVVDRSAQTIVNGLETAVVEMKTQMAQAAELHRVSHQQVLDQTKINVLSYTAEMNDATKEVTASLRSAVVDIGAHLKSVANALDAAAADHRSVTQLALADSRHALAGYSADIVRASDTVNNLSKITGQVLESQAALQVAMTQLGDSRLANVLAELDSSMKDMKPLLSNLSQPFVLQAVPVTARGVGSSGD
jgi:biopolymer transport protein ExbB/TolQ